MERGHKTIYYVMKSERRIDFEHKVIRFINRVFRTKISYCICEDCRNYYDCPMGGYKLKRLRKCAMFNTDLKKSVLMYRGKDDLLGDRFLAESRE